MWWGTQPAWLCACRYGRVSVHQTACLGRINTGLPTNPSLQTLFLSAHDPKVLKVFPHEARWFQNFPACLSDRQTHEPSTSTHRIFYIKLRGRNKTAELGFESRRFLQDALVLAARVCVFSWSGGCHRQVCPCREWKNQTEEEGKAGPRC